MAKSKEAKKQQKAKKDVGGSEPELKAKPVGSGKGGGAPTAAQLRSEGKAEVLHSEVAYTGPLFNVLKEEVREPNGCVTHRDVIRHTGSVVILAVDASGKHGAKDPLVIMERQYRHAAGQYLWELPAGKIEPKEERLAAARRELTEETGYTALQWTELVRFYASPGFLGEWMQIFLAEELTAGPSALEADETLEMYPMTLSAVEELIATGQVLDGKTLIGIGAYRQLRATRKAAAKKKKKARSEKD